MTPAKFISKRAPDWKRLDKLIDKMEYRKHGAWRPRRKNVYIGYKSHRQRGGLSAAEYLEFSRLYRAACTDLSLAGAWRLPRELHSYLESLVSRGHSNLYSYQKSSFNDIKEFFLKKIPYLVYTDVYVRICTLMFFVPLLVCMLLAYNSRDFSVLVLGEASMEAMVEMHSKSKPGVSLSGTAKGTGYYIMNNVGIDLLTFGMGVLGGVGSLFMTVFNAIYIGSILGFLLSSPVRDNILLWIIAHGPFELTAIGMSAGAGLRIGYSFIVPGGRRRMRAFLEESRLAIPIITAAGILTFCAAFLEAGIGPSTLGMEFRLLIAGACFLFMFVYFIVGGLYLKMSGYKPEV